MEPIQHLTHLVVEHVLRQAPYCEEKLLCAWRLAVGPDLARVTRVSAQDGTIAVATDDVRWHRELERSADLILGRLRGVLGRDIAGSLSLVAPPDTAASGRRRGVVTRRTSRRKAEEESS